MLCNLLLLNCPRELCTIGEVCNSNIIKQNVKILGTAHKALTDEGRDRGTISEELVSIELCDDSFQNLIANGGENLLVVFETEILDDEGEFVGVRAREDTECEVNHLEILGAGDRGEGVRASADIEDVGFLDPRDEEVSAFADGGVEDAAETVEEDGALAAVDGVERGGEGGGGGAEAEGGTGEVG